MSGDVGGWTAAEKRSGGREATAAAKPCFFWFLHALRLVFTMVVTASINQGLRLSLPGQAV